MQQSLLLLLFIGAGILLIVTAWTAFRPADDSVVLRYPGGVEIAGHGGPGRVVFPIVQWMSDPDDPAPCPLVIHLPRGDLGGDALCDWGGPAAAVQMGCPDELDIFLYHRYGTVCGVRVGLLPGGPPVEVSVAGKRFSLPVSEVDAVQLLGEPSSRAVLNASGRLRRAME
jgi:hypothetical protein